jgi:hypothetical protein
MLDNFTLIHIGKCAGGSIIHELKNIGIQFQIVHCKKPRINNSDRLIILVRDPVERFVSAYNWRKHILDKQARSGQRLGLKHSWEFELLSLFPCVNKLVEQLDPEDPTSGIHGGISLLHLIGHVTLGFSWYLDNLLEILAPGQIIAAVAVESLTEDMRNLFEIEVRSRDKSDYPKNPFLSHESRLKLAQVFDGEYRTLRRLARHLHTGGGYSPSILVKMLDNRPIDSKYPTF